MKSRREGSGPRNTVLVVDGDPKGGALLALPLRRRGFDVATASTSAAALQSITDTGPAAVVVVLDPSHAGSLLTLVQQLAGDHQTQSIPVIVAGCENESLFAQAQRIGNVVVLLGDCLPDTVATTVDRVLLESDAMATPQPRPGFPVTCPKCGEQAGVPRCVSTAAKRGTYITLFCEKCTQQWRVFRQADSPGFART